MTLETVLQQSKIEFFIQNVPQNAPQFNRPVNIWRKYKVLRLHDCFQKNKHQQSIAFL